MLQSYKQLQYNINIIMKYGVNKIKFNGKVLKVVITPLQDIRLLDK